MQPDTPLGSYVIARELGSGGMGRVYAATVTGRGRGLDRGARVALKVVHSHLLEAPGFFQRFLREADIGRSIRHPNVVRTYDCDQVIVAGQAHAFLVMEYVAGQTLRELLTELERLPEQLCLHVAREVCKGLGAIHDAGVIHRDIKPDNIIIAPAHSGALEDGAQGSGALEDGAQDSGAQGTGARGTGARGTGARGTGRAGASSSVPGIRAARAHEAQVVKVMDLGVARLQDEALRLSQTGSFVGSIHYAAPECFRDGGRSVDARADLHALGLVLYELATGSNPYYGDDVPQVLQKILHEQPRRLGEANPQLSPYFEEVVHRLLAKSPQERFASAAELRIVLEAGEDSTWWQQRAARIRADTRRPIRRIRIPRETAVHGRERELECLRAIFESAQAGEGCVVLIEGEAGIGKSRLVDEWIARLQRDGEEVQFLFGGYPPGSAATASRGFAVAYREHFGDAGCADHLRDTPVLVPAFDALLRGEPTPRGEEPLTQDSLQTCFVNATRALAQERTTVVLIEDLHFAPDEGRALFTSLAMAAPGSRLVLIGTLRPGAPGEWTAGLTRLDQTTQISLSRLGPKDLMALLRDTLKSERLAHALAGRIATKSDGNPFFIFEILRGLREGHFIERRQDGSWISTRTIDAIEIPSSVLDLVNARVADLTEDERNLLDVAACWGFEFDPLLVGDVLGLGQIPLMRALARIETRHRLVRSAGRRFVFDHHQVQEALYGALPELLREPYHAALAAALEARTHAADADPESLAGELCTDLCSHFLAGARGESALRYLAAAQTHLERAYRREEMVLLGERALGVPGLLTGRARVRLLLRLCSARELLGRRARDAEYASEAQALAAQLDDDSLHAQTLVAMGRAHWRTSRVADSVAAYQRAREIASAAGDRKVEAAAIGGLGTVQKDQGLFDDARRNLERYIEMSRELGDRLGETIGLGNLGNLFKSRGRLEEAREHHERHLALSREIGDRVGEAVATGNLGTVVMFQGHLADARALHERHLALSREIGDRLGEARATGNLGILLQSSGHLAEAREFCERYRTMSREMGNRRGEASATGNLGLILDSEGRPGEAREQFERHLAICRDLEDRAGEAIALHNLGDVEYQVGRRTYAEERLGTCLQICERFGFGHLAAVTHLTLGSLRVAGGDTAAGRAALDRALELSIESGFAAQETLARCELACLPGGDAEAALAAFAAHGGRLDPFQRRAAHLLLWRCTGDRAHLHEAKRSLDAALEPVDAETRRSMSTNVRIHREILTAWAKSRREGA